MNLKEMNERLNLVEQEEVSERVLALAQFLETEPENIEDMQWEHYGLPTYKVLSGEHEGEEYAVSASEDETYDACKEEIESLIDDVGVMNSLNWDNMGGIEKYLDEEWFRQVWEEMNDTYARDIMYENGRFKEEMIERGLDPQDYGYNEEDDSFEDEEGAIEAFTNDMMYDLENSAEGLIKEFAFQLGNENIDYAIQHGATLDMDAVTNEVITVDGAGHILSRYDGKEHKEQVNGNTYFIYRQN